MTTGDTMPITNAGAMNSAVVSNTMRGMMGTADSGPETAHSSGRIAALVTALASRIAPSVAGCGQRSATRPPT